jgi:DNA-binding MarR family transcriptional regulator
MSMDQTTHDMLAGEVTILIEHLSRLVHGLGYTEGLAPVQWSALRFFARVERERRTMSDLADFSGVNPSSASRTVSLLKEKGLITSSADPDNQRRQRIDLTTEGWRTLTADPLADLMAVVSRLAADDKVMLRRLTEAVVIALRSANRRSGA